MVRNIGAVLAGYVSIGILVVLTDLALAAIRPGEYLSGQVPPTWYFVVSLFTASLYSVFGGWLCGWIARARQWKPLLALAVFGELMGVISTIMFWGKQPWWYALALLILYPPAVFLGGYLFLRRPVAAPA
jgi:hypothetical protein